MAEENKVTLHGFWASPYSKRVELALKLKGIPYEFVEEDLFNKSQLLLKYNPVFRNTWRVILVPSSMPYMENLGQIFNTVLVHNGKPLLESLVILEYIDETWNNGPKLLPEDPYARAQVRFWTSFLQE
ncbi:hypothetical protein UlMin_008254, partial [Ulmus minor]